MKKFLLLLSVLLPCLFLGIWFQNQPQTPTGAALMGEEAGENAEKRPDDYFFAQRAYPHNQINRSVYRAARKQAQLAREAAVQRTNGTWEAKGPINVGGRITDLVLDPSNQTTIYAGTASGGIFKTTDVGNSWTPIFDDAGALSIGNLAIDPQNPQTLYAGTGEANGSFDSAAFPGDGIYKTTDGGNNWENIGLENTEHIGRIVIDPSNTERVFVAAAGTLYGKSNDRGVYRSINGGDDWEQVLFISDSTAIIDLVINPQNPNILFAASWERLRYPWGRIYGGPTSGIYRSTDGGDNWTKLTNNGLPISDENTGRIGLAIAASDPNQMYATYTTNPVTNEFSALYKSFNGGETWFDMDADINFVNSSFGWYFGNVRVTPDNSNEVYVMGVEIVRSMNGGIAFSEATQDMHVDFHALEMHPDNSDFRVIGNDGGIYVSQNGGGSWNHRANLPITQFYACELDEQNPERLYGGAQDNGTNRTLTGQNDDYERIFGGDGFYVIVDPIDNDFIYLEFQRGNIFRSTDGGFSFEWAQFGIEEDDRKNWNTPIVMDKNNTSILYTGTNHLYRSTDRAVSWDQISPDLTDGEHPSGASGYGTITTIDVSESDPNFIYIGTDDGNVQMTPNGGLTWSNISAGLPERYVSRVSVDPNDALTCYVTLSGYRYVDYQPHVLKTTDGGQTWIDVSGNLPEVPANDIIIDPANEGTLYLASDLGVWVSYNDGENWNILGMGLPNTVVCDLRLHEPTRTLLAGTYGRSFYTIDLNDVVNTENFIKDISVKVFPNPAIDHINIEFKNETAQSVGFRLVDMSGKEVAQKPAMNLAAGTQTINWNLPNQMAAGNYLIRMETEKGLVVKKVVVQR